MNILPKQSGFTLLELLLVVFLLGVLAMTTFAVVQDGDDQQRFDATKTYYQLIKKAIVGDPTLTLNGETDLSGFVADMGRLPNCLRELIEISGCDGVVGVNAITGLNDDLPVWTQDAESQVWSGWRGPYLQGIPESGIGLAFRDGWKNVGAATASGANNPDSSNYGWLFGIGVTTGACDAANVRQSVPNTLYLQSCGSDGQVSNVATGNYADDYPYLSLMEYLPMVVEADHQVVLGSEWETVLVEIVNDAGIALDIPANSLRLSMNYPINGALPVCAAAGVNVCSPGEAFAPFLSGSFPSFGWNNTAKTITLTATVTDPREGTFPAGTTPQGSAASSFTITQDGYIVVDDESKFELRGCTVASPCTVETTAPITLNTSFNFEVNAPVTLDLSGAKVSQVLSAVSGLLKPYIDVPSGSTKTGAQEITLPDSTTLTFNNNVEFMQGSERRRVIVDAVISPAIVTVSSAFTRVGNQVSVTGTTDVFMMPPGSTVDSATQLTLNEGLALPAGQRSLTVVCDNNNNPTNDYRELFDGVCDGAADDGSPVPVILKVKPRATLLPPNPIRWQIK